MHRSLEMLSDRLCKDIDESAHEEKLTPATLEMLDKAVDIIKDIETIKAMNKYGEDYGDDESYAMRRRNSYGYNSYGNSYDDMSRRMDNMSERDRKRLEDFIRQM